MLGRSSATRSNAGEHVPDKLIHVEGNVVGHVPGHVDVGAALGHDHKYVEKRNDGPVLRYAEGRKKFGLDSGRLGKRDTDWIETHFSNSYHFADHFADRFADRF